MLSSERRHLLLSSSLYISLACCLARSTSRSLAVSLLLSLPFAIARARSLSLPRSLLRFVPLFLCTSLAHPLSLPPSCVFQDKARFSALCHICPPSLFIKKPHVLSPPRRPHCFAFLCVFSRTIVSCTVTHIPFGLSKPKANQRRYMETLK